VLHGDCVFDSQLGVTILSGDTILRGLAQALQPRYCVFLADVAGLFSKPPEQPGAQLIPAVEVAADGSWSVAAAAAAGNDGSMAVQLSAAAHDTTGGIATKVAEAAGVVLAGCPVVIAQAGTASGAAAVLHGPDVFGTSSDAAAGGEQLQGTVIRLASAAIAAAGNSSS
jgi:isopentenyl phosphate kinase